MSFAFRKNTTDREIFDDVVTSNCYRLPAALPENGIAIDIGAHIGSFSYAALTRGMKKVYAYEADPGNASQLTMNLREFIEEGRMVVTNKAVLRSDEAGQRVFLGGYAQEGAVTNAGGLGVIFPRGGHSVEAIGLDEIIGAILMENQDIDRISLLKLDCEGSEWPILLTSKLLGSVESICGEFHELGGKYNDETPPFSINGIRNYTGELLPEILRPFGFSVAWHRTRDENRNGTSCGLFFATRASVFTTTYWRHLVRLNYMLHAKLLLDDLR